MKIGSKKDYAVFSILHTGSDVSNELALTYLRKRVLFRKSLATYPSVKSCNVVDKTIT